MEIIYTLHTFVRLLTCKVRPLKKKTTMDISLHRTFILKKDNISVNIYQYPIAFI